MADSKSGNSLARLKNSDRPSSSKTKVDSFVASSKKKVVETSTKIRSSSIFSTMTKKTSTQSTAVRKTVTKTRVKKVFSLAGQKFDVPEEREPLRIFYESLSEQIPSSEMAEFWLMEHGLLSPERSKRAFEKKQRKQKQIRSGIPPVKSLPPSTSSRPSQSKPSKPSQSKPESSKKPEASKNGEVKAKKRMIDDSDDEDDFVPSHKRRKG